MRLSERTIAGLERAKAQGHMGGRPRVQDDPKTVKALLHLRKQGKSLRQIAAELSLSTNTVLKVLRAGQLDAIRESYTRQTEKSLAQFRAKTSREAQ